MAVIRSSPRSGIEGAGYGTDLRIRRKSDRGPGLIQISIDDKKNSNGMKENGYELTNHIALKRDTIFSVKRPKDWKGLTAGNKRPKAELMQMEENLDIYCPSRE